MQRIPRAPYCAATAFVARLVRDVGFNRNSAVEPVRNAVGRRPVDVGDNDGGTFPHHEPGGRLTDAAARSSAAALLTERVLAFLEDVGAESRDDGSNDRGGNGASW